jgi:hypothetical protein
MHIILHFYFGVAMWSLLPPYHRFNTRKAHISLLSPIKKHETVDCPPKIHRQSSPHPIHIIPDHPGLWMRLMIEHGLISAAESHDGTAPILCIEASIVHCSNPVYQGSLSRYPLGVTR